MAENANENQALLNNLPSRTYLEFKTKIELSNKYLPRKIRHFTIGKLAAAVTLGSLIYLKTKTYPDGSYQENLQKYSVRGLWFLLAWFANLKFCIVGAGPGSAGFLALISSGIIMSLAAFNQFMWWGAWEKFKEREVEGPLKHISWAIYGVSMLNCLLVGSFFYFIMCDTFRLERNLDRFFGLNIEAWLFIPSRKPKTHCFVCK